MNDDFADLERELKRLRPAQTSTMLEDALLLALSARPERHRSWRRRSEFLRAAAAFGWSIAAAACVAVAALYVLRDGPGPASSSVPIAQHAAEADALPRAYESAQASNVLYETQDDGVVYNAARKPARKLRYRSEDTLRWKNPRTGAQLEISYPREETVLVPIAMQ